MSSHPNLDALIVRLAREVAPSTCVFLSSLAARTADTDLRAFLEAWSRFESPPGFVFGPLTLPKRRPAALDRIPIGWKHEDYGCADMTACDFASALIVGTALWHGESRAIYTHPERSGDGFHVVPWWDERGASEGT